MKKLYVATFGVLGVLLLAAPGSAAPPPLTPVQPAKPVSPASGIQQMNPLKLHSVTRAPNAASGYFMIDIAVENLGSTPKSMSVEAHAAGASASPPQTAADVPAHTVKHFVFVDVTGGPSICSLGSGKEYAIAIGEPGAAPVAHTAILRASACGNLSATASNPWWQKAPDHVDAITKSTLYAEDASIVEQPTCDKPVKVKVKVVNHTASAQNGLHVVAKDGPTVKGSSATINLPKGDATTTTVSYSPTSAAATTIALQGGSNIADAGLSVTVNASCTWSAEIDPKPQPAPAIPR